MNIGEVVGNKVMVLFHSAEGLKSIGIDDTTKYCRIVGFDNIGIWIENPNYEETPIRDEDGKLIPPEQRVREHHVANILVPWGNVRAVVHFPERTLDEPESEEVRPIGSYL